MIFVAITISVVVLSFLLWLVLGRGPRQRRALGHAQRLTREGRWQEALALLAPLQEDAALSEAWRERARQAAGECHQLAARDALREKRYEDGLALALRAAPLLGAPEGEQRAWVIDAMLAEARRLFAAAGSPVETEAVVALIARITRLEPVCPEAAFWLGLCLLRQGQAERAVEQLSLASSQAGRDYLDPAFYLGLVQHRQGNYQEAVRCLSEANRVDSSCPFVTLQLGMSMLAAGGDTGIALRALQRALGPRGLPMWLRTPERAWVEAFPETKSYVRRLAQKHRFVCPILGGDLAAILRLGQQAQAQAHYQLCQFQEAVTLYTTLIQEAPPTAPVLRGLGLALARLQRYDQAYKHLRAALEMEGGKDPLTAGYLALCGALGKPSQPEDKPRNVAWAIRLLARYQLAGDAEWASIYSAVFTEARSLGMALSLEDQVQLCNVLAGVHAHDPDAAASYAHLAQTFPQAVLPRHAWLYCRGVAAHNYSSPQDLDLFVRTFKDPRPARQYFERFQWNFDDVEYRFLERAALRQPGRFPEVLGPDYPARGEGFLLERSRQAEEAGQGEQARQAVEVLLELVPRSTRAIDRLACLHYRQGSVERAVQLLDGWQKLEPSSHWPVVRQAILEQERGNARKRAEAIERALGLTRGTQRAAVAFLGARLALRETADAWQASPPGDDLGQTLLLPLTLLEECLKDDPRHLDGLIALASLRALLGQQEELAALAGRFQQVGQAGDPRFSFLAAICCLAAGDHGGTLRYAQQVGARGEVGQGGADADLLVRELLEPESYYLMGWAFLRQGTVSAAQEAFRRAAAVATAPSAPLARAILGRLGFVRGDFEEAVRSWGELTGPQRAGWMLEEPFRQAVFLAGLTALEKGQYEEAANRFREAGAAGLRDRRLGPLITLALVKAAQQQLY